MGVPVDRVERRVRRERGVAGPPRVVDRLGRVGSGGWRRSSAGRARRRGCPRCRRARAPRRSAGGPVGGASLQVLVQRVLDQRVHEAVAAELLLGLADEPGADRTVEQIEQSVLVDVDQPGEHVEVELAADHRGERQRLLGRFAEARDAMRDDLAHARRQAEVVEIAGEHPAAGRRPGRTLRSRRGGGSPRPGRTDCRRSRGAARARARRRRRRSRAPPPRPTGR